MPYRACESCGQPAQLLIETSKMAMVDYYRCDTCGDVWVHDRQDPELAPERVTRPATARANEAEECAAAASATNPVECPHCHQTMEHIGAIPAEQEGDNQSDIYRCPTDGYWSVDNRGRVEHVRQR
jgi:protein-arginine kinase activator protein McsA